MQVAICQTFQTHLSLTSFLWDIGKQCSTRSGSDMFCIVCLQNVFLFDWNWNLMLNNPQIWDGFVHLIEAENSISHKYVN